MIQEKILELTEYGLVTGLIEPEDKRYTINRLLELFGLDEMEEEVERRLQMPHDFRVRQQPVQRVRVTGLHFANRDIHRFPPLNLNMSCVSEKSA